MLRIDQLRLLPGEPEAALLSKCARLLRTDPSALTGLTVLRRAIDAREGLTFVYTVAVSAPQETALLRRCRDKRVTAYAPERYALPAPVAAPEVRPIVVGAGPAGLFAALVLARCGARPILLERGRWQGVIDRDAVLQHLEEHLAELSRLLERSEDAVLLELEQERERVTEALRRQHPEIASYLAAHREELEQRFQRKYPEAAQHIHELRQRPEDETKEQR